MFVDGNLVDAEDPLAVMPAVDNVEDVVGVEAEMDGIVEDGGVADGVAVGEFSAASGYGFQDGSPMRYGGRVSIPPLYDTSWIPAPAFAGAGSARE